MSKVRLFIMVLCASLWADSKATATNFLNALEKIPGIISQRKEKNEALANDIP